jgi:SAM-dependent methyltransferase
MINKKNFFYNTSVKFWKNSQIYPSFNFLKKRRIYETNYILSNLTNKDKSILDIGCGDCSLLNILICLHEFNYVYGFDISKKLLKNAHHSITTRVFDIYNNKFNSFPHTNVVIIAGLIQYIEDDKILSNLFKSIKTKKILLRSAFVLKGPDIVINKYSSKLKSRYASKYRSIESFKNILNKNYEIISVKRIYPDRLESKFGTKQFYLKLVKK